MSSPLTITIAGPQAAAFKQKIREEATRRGLSISEMVVEAVAEFFRKEQNGTNHQ